MRCFQSNHEGALIDRIKEARAWARGILVNITAGLDLSLGEFSEVGDAVEEFASDNATVVVGTVIDPDMSEPLVGVTMDTVGGAEGPVPP